MGKQAPPPLEPYIIFLKKNPQSAMVWGFFQQRSRLFQHGAYFAIVQGFLGGVSMHFQKGEHVTVSLSLRLMMSLSSRATAGLGAGVLRLFFLLIQRKGHPLMTFYPPSTPRFNRTMPRFVRSSAFSWSIATRLPS